jgi:hypothetical protein
LPLDGGVLVANGGTVHELVGTELVANPKIATNSERRLQHAGPILGWWSNNAWKAVEIETGGDRESSVELSLYRWRPHQRWVSQQFRLPEEESSGRHVDLGGVGVIYNVSVAGGIVIAEEAGDELLFSRSAGGRADPPTQPILAGNVTDFLETRGGRLFVITDTHASDQTLRIQRSCDDGGSDCVRANTLQLRASGGDRLEVQHLVARGRWSASFAIAEEASPEARYWLAHYDKEWALEATPGGEAPVRMLGRDGSKASWLLGGGGQLWHRDAKGTWSSVALPDGAAGAKLQLSHDKDGAIWLARVGDDTPTLWKASWDPASSPVSTQ